MKPRTRFGIAVIAVAVALMVYAVFFERNTGLGIGPGNAMSNLSKEEVAEFIGVPLPLDAEEIHAFTERGIDQIMYVAFFASPRSVEAFLRVLAIKEPLREGYNPLRYTSRDDLPWWTVTTMTDSVGVDGNRNQDESKAYELAIDRVTSTSWHVFLRVFEVY